MITTITTSLVVTIEVDMSKLQSKKSLSINEGWSSTVKPTTIANKVKGNGVKLYDKEKKRLKELAIDKLKQLNNFLRKRENDPLGMNKTWNYETIKIMAFREVDAFEKMPKESFIIENTPLQQ